MNTVKKIANLILDLAAFGAAIFVILCLLYTCIMTIIYEAISLQTIAIAGSAALFATSRFFNGMRFRTHERKTIQHSENHAKIEYQPTPVRDSLQGILPVNEPSIQS